MKVLDKEICFEAGGLICCEQGNNINYVNDKIKNTVENKLIEKFKNEAAIVNDRNNVIEIYLKSSNKCNLKCSYCFRKVQNIEFNPQNIQQFICMVIDKYNCKKVKIDLTGDSEPLMEINKLKDIIDICNNIGIDRGIEFVYSLNSNGTYFDESILKFLYDNSILFGFTIEGFSLKQYKRIYKDGKIAQDDVLANIKKYNLDKNPLFGTSMTLTSEHTDLVKEYSELIKICNAVSMRIVNVFDESGVIDNNVDDWINMYNDLACYLLNELKEKRYDNFLPIIRSRDFFGTYIKAMLFNVRRNQACLGGYKQLFLNYTGEVFVCSWGYSDEKYKVGNYQELIEDRIEHYKNYTVDTDEMCKDCEVRYICGGECHIIRGDNTNLNAWCKLKRHLVGLAFYISDWMKCNDENGLDYIKKSVLSNSFYGEMEPYITVIMNMMSKKNIIKSPNDIKNEISCLTNGPSLDSFLQYIKKYGFKASIANKYAKEDGKYYIVHSVINNYNNYSFVDQDLDYTELKDSTIIEIH